MRVACQPPHALLFTEQRWTFQAWDLRVCSLFSRKRDVFTEQMAGRVQTVVHSPPRVAILSSSRYEKLRSTSKGCKLLSKHGVDTQASRGVMRNKKMSDIMRMVCTGFDSRDQPFFLG